MRGKKALFLGIAAPIIIGIVLLRGLGTVHAQDDNHIQNPCFAEEDLSVWQHDMGGAVISAQVSEEPIFDDVVTFGAITDRTSPYDCIAQDITAWVKNETEYTFSFWAKLSDDYEGAPPEQRVIAFAPYVTTSVNGQEQTEYWGSYTQGMVGDSATLEPGVWTLISGSFKVSYKGELKLMAVRLLEQGTNYGSGDCVMGDYYVTGVTIQEKNADRDLSELIETDLPNLKDAVGEELCPIFGTGITAGELADDAVWALVTKHFNAVTLGNELKPDALFGYSNARCPGTVEAELDGEILIVPVLDFSRAERMLDKIKAWNEANPENQIKVRGHVLVWHSQTPEWFFHEDYDKNKPYVDKETMDKRLKWYIKTVLEHFTGEGSPYEGMFYGWDVVNEAVSDGSGSYRTDAENPNEELSADTHGSNSSWYHIYQSNEYIINAFKYANQYAPASVELYYNDYNECVNQKVFGIVELLKAVKAQAGAPGEGTRIDAFGMQGHYNMTDPSFDRIDFAVRMYAAVVGKVQITEMDLSASDTYDGTDASKEEEYRRQTQRYRLIYNILKGLNEDEDIEVSGWTFWGVVDKYSWLQNRSDVGGGSTKSRPQCPLLFDDDYHAKPAFWVFADATRLSSDGSLIMPEDAQPEKEENGTDESQAGTDETVSSQDPGDSEENADAKEEKSSGASGTLAVVLGIIVAVLLCFAVAAGIVIKRKRK